MSSLSAATLATMDHHQDKLPQEHDGQQLLRQQQQRRPRHQHYQRESNHPQERQDNPSSLLLQNDWGYFVDYADDSDDRTDAHW
eukprot:CAMPEP_0178776226 /NCGR_PEP_ID=MMETSP0744-20121128/24610_1 /TAXON_ID=913974 /ORGANISM="Nitzschia punctata, Strain CCMP561" /LENGTH=83 /DNA_ID=CAMNT_0020433251 /DNA_START=313 /DNA_END=564 /DNA_ORIENTATION=+